MWDMYAGEFGSQCCRAWLGTTENPVQWVADNISPDYRGEVIVSDGPGWVLFVLLADGDSEAVTVSGVRKDGNQ